MKTVRAALLLMLSSTAYATQQRCVAAEDTTSSNYMLPFCKEFINNGSANFPVQGECVGIVNGIGYMLVNWHQDNFICAAIPNEVTKGQTVRVVIRYIEQHPEDMHKDFRRAVTLALMRAWPCK